MDDNWPGSPVTHETAQEWPGTEYSGSGRSRRKRGGGGSGGSSNAPAFSAGIMPASPTGQVHDGDTFGLSDGRKGRLWGADAFELAQTGVGSRGTVPLGTMSRDWLKANMGPSSMVGPVQSESYGRPVVPLSTNGRDVARDEIGAGMAMAAPDYLKADPMRLRDYMEAERHARLNRFGAHAGQFQMPDAYRRREPWQPAERGTEGNSVAVFNDEPLPFQGLRPEIAKGYLDVSADPKSTVDDIMGYADRSGFMVNRADVEAFVKKRNAAGGTNRALVYQQPPRVLTDTGGGAVMSFARGLGDPINMLDELGGLVDTVDPTGNRENIWNSDRRFGDILYNNVDQNRSILAFDEANHGWARLGGQFLSGFAIPGGAAEAAGARAAAGVLADGGGAFLAEKAGQAAFRRSAATAGAVEGSLAGVGAGEGGLRERVPGGIVGAAVGGVLGTAGGELINAVTPRLKTLLGRKAAEATVDGADGQTLDQAVKVADDLPATGAGAGEWPGSEMPSAAMASDNAMPSIMGPRVVDRIDLMPRPRPMSEPTPAQVARLGQVEPHEVLPLPSNITSEEEIARLASGVRPEVRAPNELEALARRDLPSPRDGTRTLPKRGPVDLVTFIRSKGGLIDQGGEVSYMGLDNASRDLDFARGESRFGKFVDNQAGMRLDDAADLAWRAGYFPDMAERPTISEFLDALKDTHVGNNRRFLPEDVQEVADFEAQRTQRYAVEEAAQRGQPLVNERGDAPTLADLEANTPPVSAYEDATGQGLSRVGNIRVDRLDTPQDISRALDVARQSMGGFDNARRGVITQEETARLASELNMTPDSLLARRKGQAFNAEEALAARQILAKSGNELVNLARRIQRLEDPGDELLAQFRQAMVRHAAIQEQIAGATAEAGRALQQFRMMADSRNVHGSVLAGLVQGGGGRGRIKDAADMIIDAADDPATMNKLAVDASKPRFRDKLVELWYNSLLSGPQTHVVNMVSNTMTAIAQIPEHAAAATLGGARALATRNAQVDRVMFSELGARAFGLLQGTKEGLRQFGRTFRTGEPSDFVSKVEAQSEPAISGRVGQLVRIPTRALAAEDEIFKAMARRMEIGGLAVRQAKKEGLKGEAARTRIAELVANPTEDMMTKALDYGRYLTFQRPLGDAMRHIAAATQAAPGMKLFLPFVRTPINLLKFAGERSPAAPLIKEWRADFRAGGARRDLALARAMTGTGLGMAVMELAANGNITGGGPADQSAGELLRADGWQPYSIRIGDRYYSYSRLDPFSMTLGVAADLATKSDYMTDKQREEVTTLLVTSIMKNLANKTWLSGIGGLTQAINDPERYGGSFVQRIAGSLAVPAGVAQVARTVDPTLREAETILDAVKARVPFLSRTLEPKRDVWGQPIVSQGGLGPDIVSPVWTSQRANDPINNALLGSGLHVTEPRRDVGGVRLPLRQYGEYREVAGALGRNALLPVVTGQDWQTMTRDDRSDAVQDTLRGTNRMARRMMFGNASQPRP